MAPIRIKLNVKTASDSSPSSRVTKKPIIKLTISNTKLQQKSKRAPKNTAPTEKVTAKPKPKANNLRKRPAKNHLPKADILPPGHSMRAISTSSSASDVSYATGWDDEDYLDNSRNNPVELVMTDDFLEGSAIQVVMQSIEQPDDSSLTYVHGVKNQTWYKGSTKVIAPAPYSASESSVCNESGGEGETRGRDEDGGDEDADGEWEVDEEVAPERTRTGGKTARKSVILGY